MPDLAAVSDLVNAWRPLSAAETTTANYYLGFASRRVRDRWPNVDSRLAAGSLTAESVSDVVVQMVLGIVDGAPVRQARSWSETRGPISQSVTLQPGKQELITFEDWMVRVFDGNSASTVPRGSFPPAESLDGVLGRRMRRY